MRLVHWLCESRTGRTVVRLSRKARLAGARWDPVPEAPYEVAGAIAPTPLLIVHGGADRYFPLPHVHLLRDSAPSAQVWIEAGMGHAESATTPELIERVHGWLASAVVPDGVRSQVCDDGRRD